MDVLKGEIYLADLSPVVGSEQGGVRPVIIVQNNIGNKYSTTVIISAITSKLNKAKLPTHVEIEGSSFGLAKNSVVLCEQVRTIDKRRLKMRLGMVDGATMRKIDKALMVSLGINLF